MKVYAGMKTYLDSSLNSVLGMISGHFYATPPLPRGKEPSFPIAFKAKGATVSRRDEFVVREGIRITILRTSSSKVTQYIYYAMLVPKYIT
jgi:hypothetical protein